MNNWYEDKEFWERMAPKLFNKSHWDKSSKEIDQIIVLTGIQPRCSVLDLCCGPGRHSLELARRGYKVTAVDLTAAYLEEAKLKAKSEGIYVEFIREDMRRFERPDSYNAIILMYTSFGYFENQNENLKVLINSFHSLSNGGSLIIDLMGKEILARKYQEREWNRIGGDIFLEERKIIKNWTQVENRCIMFDDNQKKEYKFTHWIYSASELSELLYKCGFSNVTIYGSLDGEAYDDKAERLIAVAVK